MKKRFSIHRSPFTLFVLVLSMLSIGATLDVLLLQEVATPESGNDFIALLKPGGGASKDHKIKVGNLVPKPSDAGLTNEVWIAVRTDGKSGDGTQRNPFDGSNQAKFDAILHRYYANNTQNLVVHLAPGNFLTSGSAGYNSTAGYYLHKGWNIRGSGMDVTTLTHSPAPPPRWPSGPAKHLVLEASIYNQDSDGIEISDLTIDANWPNCSGGYTNKAVDAIGLWGSNCRVSRVHIKNTYGNVASGMESFGIGIGPSFNQSNSTVYPVTNAVIEDCVADNYQGDYGAAFSVGPFTGTGAPAPYWSNLEVIGCTVFNWFGSGARMGASVIRNCYAYNCNQVIRVDTVNSDDSQMVITGNNFFNCKGNVIDLTPALGGHNLVKPIISNNNIEITDQGGAAIALEGGNGQCVIDAVVSGNRIWQKFVGGRVTPYSFYFAGANGLVVRDNIINDGLTARFDDRTKAGATTNKSLLFNRTNTGAAIPTLRDTDPGHAILPVCVLGSGSDQRVANSAYTKLTIWSRTAAYAHDPDNMYADGVVTVPISGIYDISANNGIDSNSANVLFAIYVNGSNSHKTLANFHGSNWLGGSVSMKLNAKDKVAIYAWQNTGGNLNFYGADNSASFSVRCRHSD
jgi:hypothetical protein